MQKSAVNFGQRLNGSSRSPMLDEIQQAEQEYSLSNYVRLKYKPVKAKDRANCVSGYVVGQSSSNTWFKPVSCNKEYCEVCGSDQSYVHNRRIRRLNNRVQAMVHDPGNKSGSVGYLVITLPDELRQFADISFLKKWKTYWKRKLKRPEQVPYVVYGKDSKTGVPGVYTGYLKRKAYDHGVIRYHYCGDDGFTYKPHLNILIPEGYLDKRILDKLKLDNSLFLKKYFKLDHLPAGNIYYGYDNRPGKIKHIVKYVTRSTLRKVTPENQFLLPMLKGYRNTTTFGKFYFEFVPEYLLIKEAENIDPKDNTEIKYFGFSRFYLYHIAHGRASGVEIDPDTGVIRANNNIVLLDDSKYRLLKPDKGNKGIKRNYKGPRNMERKKIKHVDFDFMPFESRLKVYWMITAGTAVLV